MSSAPRRLVSALVAVGLLAAACSGGGGHGIGRSTPTSSRSKGSSSSAPRAAGRATGATLGGTEGGTLRIGLGGPIQPDPQLASPADPGQEMVLDLLHRGLTRVDADGHLQPDLATVWTADPAFTVWRFTIDPTATFTSGRPVTATDVVGSLEHVIAAGATSLAALRLEDVHGFQAFLDRTAPSVAGLLAVDATTVQITLDHPLSVLPDILAAPAYGIVDLTSLAAAEQGDLKGLDLSGGWRVASASTGHLVLARRPVSAAHLDTIDVRAFKDADAAYAAFGKGSVDWAPVPTDQVGAARGSGTGHLTPYDSELAIGLRAAQVPSVGLRQAVAAAVDRGAIVDAVYADLADPLATVVPAGITGHDDHRCTTCAFDVGRARQLVAQAYPDGKVPTLTFAFDASPAQEALGQIVARDLKAVGIPVMLQPMSLRDYQHLLVTGTEQLFTLSWIAADRTPDAYLDPLFRSDSPDNLTGFASPAVDGLLAQARSSVDPAVQQAAWASAEQQVLESAVVVPIAQFRSQVVVAKRVLGLLTAVDGTVDWAAVRVAGGA